MGVGWENHDGYSFESTYQEKPWRTHDFSSSDVKNNCAGSSRTWSQDYLLGLEILRGRQICFGTDINGLIVGPGPRFGPQAAFSAYNGKHGQIMAQKNGVRYDSTFVRPITSSVFLGRAVDPEGYPWAPANYDHGFSYNTDQRDFMVALNIFHWKTNASDQVIHTITQALHDDHPNKVGIELYTKALVASAAGVSWDKVDYFSNVGWAVYRFRNGNQNVVQEDFMKGTPIKDRFSRLLRVWDEYERIFGNNVPLKRCETATKQWDINFEGVAHYGMLPDFLQDLSNVGLNAQDMSPIFQSAEDFARMWTRCLRGSYNIIHPPLSIKPEPPSRKHPLTLAWFGEPGDAVEETDNLNDPKSWRPFEGQVEHNGRQLLARPTAPEDGVVRFYRLRKN